MPPAPWGRTGPSLLAAALALACLLPMGALAAGRGDAGRQDPDAARQQLQNAERQRAAGAAAQKAADARASAARAQQQRLATARVAAAAKLQDADKAVQDAADRLAGLAQRKDEAEKRLAARAAAMAPLLPLIERLSLFPAETVLAVPAPPEEALRGVLVMKGLAAQLETEAAGLRKEQAEVAALTQQMSDALPALQSAQQAQRSQAAALDGQIAAARQTEQAAEDASDEAARQAAAAASRADSLRDVIARIETARRAAEAAARAEQERAERQRKADEAARAAATQQALAQPAGPGLPAEGGAATNGTPVVGRVIKAFGTPGDAGPANGISYEAAPGARVVSPCAGRAVFAGPFRSFGQLVILDCGGGYHFVLAGLDRLDVQLGHPVQAGEPIGVMPNWDPKATGPRPALYVELRHAGQAVNPAPWLKSKG